jgi:hypothetical protein
MDRSGSLFRSYCARLSTTQSCYTTLCRVFVFRMMASGDSSATSTIDEVLRSTSLSSKKYSLQAIQLQEQLHGFERHQKEAARPRRESARFHSVEEFMEIQCMLVLPGRTAERKLRRACQKGNSEEVRGLLAAGCEPAATDEAFERTAMHWAAFNGDVEVGKLLFTHPSTISLFDAQDLSKFTALHIAAERGHTGFTKLLIRHRADPLLRTSAGNTPLHYAAFNNHIETAQLILSWLISNSKNLDLEFDVTLSNMRNNDRQTPMELAESRGHLLLASRLEDILEDFVRPSFEHNEMLARYGLSKVNDRIQSAYLESIKQTIAENVASRPCDRRGLRGFETSPAQQLRDRIQEHRGIQIHRLQTNYADFTRRTALFDRTA